MTVKDLREALAGLPDDLPVMAPQWIGGAWVDARIGRVTIGRWSWMRPGEWRDDDYGDGPEEGRMAAVVICECPSYDIGIEWIGKK